MIKIRTDRFDMEQINAIYDELTDSIYKKYSTCSDVDIKTKFKDYFLGDLIAVLEETAITKENVKKATKVLTLEEENFKKRIKEFLLTPDIDKIDEAIEYFHKTSLKKDRSLIKLKLDEKKEKILKEIFLKEEKEYNSKIELIISYDRLSSNQRHRLLQAMHVEVCPYCNRQYITIWEDEKNNPHSTADLDHYYYKDKYPIASLCLYNFIPSCQICNSRLKLTKDFYQKKHVYPYNMEFGSEAMFNVYNVMALFGEAPKFGIVKENLSEEITNSLTSFRINEIYQSHAEYIKELINKVVIYNETQLDEYLKQYDTLFSSKKEILEFIFGDIISNKEFEQKPLGKITYDILYSYGIVE